MDLRQHRLELHLATSDALVVQRFVARESMSALFEVTIEFTCPDQNLAFEAILGRPARFRATHSGGDRVWSGVASRIVLLEAPDAVHGVSTYRLTLVPALWFATQRRNHRMFQQLTELAIVEQLLGEWEVEPTRQISGAYQTRKVRVQYGESDFAFMSRMLEDAGVSFYFEDDGDETKLVLHDAPHGREPRRAPLRYRQSESDRPRDFAADLKIDHRVRPGRYTVRDHDYRRSPRQPLAATSEESLLPVEPRLERFHYAPGAFLYGSARGEATPVADDRGKTRALAGEGEDLARRRLRAKRAGVRTVEFATGAFDLSPGKVVRFEDHARAELDPSHTWLVVETTLSGSPEDGLSLVCRAVTTAVEYRPPLVTPKPRVVGVESATVVGPEGDEIHTDEFGRVRVHFHWDRESRMDEASSCWIHVVQPWSGAGYGGLNLPRVGQEVIVDFLGGDPDRPVITGRVYTNLQKVPYRLPEHKTRSTWKSDSSPGSNGFNEIMFEDLKGQELVWQQAEKNQRRLVKNDEFITVGRDRQKLVKRDETETTLANRAELTEGHRLEITDLTRTVHIGGSLSKRVVGPETRRTNGARQRMTDQNEDIVVGGDEKQHVVGHAHRRVDATYNERVGQKRSLIVGQDDHRLVGRDHALSAGREIYLHAGDKVVLEAGARISIKGPGGFIDIHAGGIDIVGNLVRINSGGAPAEGVGSSPSEALVATQASPPDPPRPVVDDVSKTGIAQ